MKPRVIVLDGPIAAGKTTLLKELYKRFGDNPDIGFVREPLNDWAPVLESFYKGEDVAFELQLLVMMAFFIKIRNTLRLDHPKWLICDRFIDSGPDVFAPIQTRMGRLTKEQQELVQKVKKTLVRHLEIGPIFRFFLTGPPEYFMRNVEKRNRPMEKELSFSYMKELCEEYLIWRETFKSEDYSVLPAGEKCVAENISAYIDSLLLQDDSLN